VFCPEAYGIRNHEQERIRALRAKRTLTITELNTTPITDPARQILFTSNALLTVPSASSVLDAHVFSEDLKKRLLEMQGEPQVHFYDHPIPMGVEGEKNEVLYGLRSLDAAIECERDRGTIAPNARLACLVSVSVTHCGLQGIAKRYLEEELARSVKLKNIDVYISTEADTQRMIDEVLAPGAVHYLHRRDAKELLSVFGVNGEYGRHYSFLKAVASFWSILIQPEVCATFKIDLDQVFPQTELVTQTGSSAFGHFMTPLWGSRARGSDGHPVDLGMIAGALVDEQDIGKSLFTPDVPFPNHAPSVDESIFFSTLPQALSTEAEMMTRYRPGNLDGKKTCIQRIHVTGGTNGILVECLRSYRPFTPSFIGRAEDQAYILSVLATQGTTMGYVHKDGLIMRHDTHTLTQEAIQSTYVPKLVGDYVRIINFSAYAKVLTNDVTRLKEGIDPFTGCFVSKIPTTVVYVRFALKAASLFTEGNAALGLEFIRNGAMRIAKALDFVSGEHSLLRQCYEKERLGWNLYYDTLSAIEDALTAGDGFAQALRKKAQAIIAQCLIRCGSP
jgi:hypothetical protein